jgi:hypothetical protein
MILNLKAILKTKKMQLEKRNEEKLEMQKTYCGACHEDPCMCSDPEQTSTVTDW